MGVLILLFGLISIGYCITKVFKSILPGNFLPPYIFLLGSYISIPLIYYIRLGLPNLYYSLIVYFIFSCVICVFFIRLKRKNLKHIYKYKYELIVFIVSSFIFFYLFNRSFSYSESKFLITSNLYLDLGAHIPFIRSFSQDINFPFEVPFYSDSPVPYHFMFDFYTGLLEYSGIRIDIAYNLLSALTLSSLLFICLDFGRTIFKKQLIGIIAFIVFLSPFNYSFFDAIRTKGVVGLRHNSLYNFSSFLGPNTAGNFLYINTYLNQRHLIFSLAVALITFLLLFNLLKKQSENRYKDILLIAMFTSCMYLWNMSIFLALSIFLFTFLMLSGKRIISLFYIFTSFLFVIFQAIPYRNFSAPKPLFSPGYLIHDNFSIVNIVLFWVINLGAGVVFIILGFIYSTKSQKKVFLSILPIFVLPNIFQFTHEMFDNHKFFNFWYLIMCFYISYFLVLLFYKTKIFRLISIFIFLCLIITSISNLFVFKNDTFVEITDYKKTMFGHKMQRLVQRDMVALTNGEIYDPASLTGIKTYLGRSHYLYLYGLNPTDRIVLSETILNGANDKERTRLIKTNMIKYIIIYKNKDVKNVKEVRRTFFDQNLHTLYEDDFGIIYKI